MQLEIFPEMPGASHATTAKVIEFRRSCLRAEDATAIVEMLGKLGLAVCFIYFGWWSVEPLVTKAYGRRGG